MPISCPGGGKPRYRARKTSKGTQRLAFCDGKVKEVKNLKTGETKILKSKAKARGRLGSD